MTRLFFVFLLFSLNKAQNPYNDHNGIRGPVYTTVLPGFQPLNNNNRGLNAPLLPSQYQSDDHVVQVTVQLKDYVNSRLALDDSRTCTCTSEDCMRVSPQGMGFRCLFTFMVIVTSSDNVVHYKSTEFLPLTNYGQIDGNFSSKFNTKFEFLLKNQPMAINVFVYNLGPVINTYNHKLEQANTLYHVDSFVVPLNGSNVNDNNIKHQISGNLLGTQLGISYSTSCRNDLIGAGCDLQCNRSTANSQSAVCQNIRSGFYSLCRFDGPKHVTDCKNCPWGIKESAYCMDERGGVLEAQHVGVVSDKYKTATIILGCVSGLLVVMLVVVVAVLCCTKLSPSGNRPIERQFLTHGDGDEIRPLTRPFSTTPKPSPRTQELKPVIRPTYPLPMPSHLSQPGSSMNSSFSSVHPPNVHHSVSADV